MDQDAFRQLLTSSRQLQPNSKHTTPSVVRSPKNTNPASSEPAFKPRRVKKNESRYRDRAAERREGFGNDYAEVEAVLEDFERRVAHEDKGVVEQQRKYLGGDSQHTILVKGLDMSLLEQNRVHANAAEDDEILEQAFAEATPVLKEHTRPKKRTREDIIRDLKAKRQSGDGAVVAKSAEGDLEAAKSAGKFTPIGFKPIGQTEDAKKKRKGKERKERKEDAQKKKQKVEAAPTPVPSGTNDISVHEVPPVSQECDINGPSSSKMSQKPSESGPLDEDFDIFAGAGDYEGFPDGEESEEYPETEEIRALSTTQDGVPPVPGIKGWFGETEPEAKQASVPPAKSPPVFEREEESQEIRLKPLESSAVPSIRDFLAMDEAVEKAEKRKARKEKKKKEKKAGDDDDD